MGRVLARRGRRCRRLPRVVRDRSRAGRAPRGLRDLIAFALGYGGAGGRSSSCSRRATRRPTPYWPSRSRGSRAPRPHRRRGRPRAAAPHGFLPPLPRDPPLRLDRALVDRGRLRRFAAWVVALATGRVPDSLHRFLAAYVRYATHLVAFVYLIGRRFPGFTGRAGSYGVTSRSIRPTEQSRWKTLFRFFLSLPALILASALGGVALRSRSLPGGTRSGPAGCPRGCGTSAPPASATRPRLRVHAARHEPLPVWSSDPS